MEKNNKSIALFGEANIRREWDAENEKWWFSVVDVVGALTDQTTSDGARNYWKVLKHRLIEEGFQLVTNCNQLKLLSSDGKRYKTDVADQEQLLRIIQSIPSKKAEPFKRWLASVGSERLDQISDPEKSINQALRDYKRLGYSDSWINQRLKSIEIRKDLTDAWSEHGVTGKQFASLTDIIYKTWAGKTTKEYKEHKGLKKENLRDNMTNGELLMNMLAEYSTTSITNAKNPQNYFENAECAVEGGNIAKQAKEQLEKRTGQKVVSELNASEMQNLLGKQEEITSSATPTDGTTTTETLTSESVTTETSADETAVDEGVKDEVAYPNNIAVLRRMRGHSQAYMAAELGIARQTYINIEKGEKELTISQLAMLERILQATMEDILNLDIEATYRKFLR